MKEHDLTMTAEHNLVRLMKTMPSSKKSRTAFTLTELCVVITCVAVLAMLVLPALAAAKPKDQTANCISNLRKWSLAQQLYATENTDTIPCDGTMENLAGRGTYGQYGLENLITKGPTSPQDSVAWYNVLPQLVGDQPLSYYYALPGGNVLKKYPNPGNTKGRIWVCPAARYASADPAGAWLQVGEFGLFCYVMDLDLKLYSSINNGTEGNAPYWPNGVKVTSVRHPSAQVFMFDAKYSPTYEGGRNSGTYPAARWDYFPQRHNLGGVICFLDGHAAYFKQNYVTNGCVGRGEGQNSHIWWNPNRDK